MDDNAFKLVNASRPIPLEWRYSEDGLDGQISGTESNRICWDSLKTTIIFDQVSEFDRGRIVAYQYCGLSFREIGSCVGRNQTTATRICDRWMQEGATDRRVRSHPPQCTTSRADRQIVRMAVTDRSATSRTVAQHIKSVTHHPVSARTIRRRLQQSEGNEIVFTDGSRFCLQHHDGQIRVWRHRGERMLNSCVMHRHIGPAPGIMVLGGIGYHSRTPLVRIAGTLNNQRYISEDNARPHVAHIVRRFFVNRQIELIPWPARFPDLSPMESMWSMVDQRLTQITSPAATPDKLRKRVEAAWSAIPQEHIQSSTQGRALQGQSYVNIPGSTQLLELQRHPGNNSAETELREYSQVATRIELCRDRKRVELREDSTGSPQEIALQRPSYLDIPSQNDYPRHLVRSASRPSVKWENLKTFSGEERMVMYNLQQWTVHSGGWKIRIGWRGMEEKWERQMALTPNTQVMKSRIEQNPGPPTKKQTTLTASVHSGERESIDGELKMLILNMATEIKSLGERIDIRLTKIETRMDDWDMRFCNIEEKLTKCIESQQATEKLASCNSLKPNLVFYGIEREGDENQADCNLKIQNIIRDKMEIGDDLKITKCHRLSRGSNAPVLVVVPDYADRAKIFKNAYKLRDTKISISKDYSKNVREQRRILIAKRKELGERGIKSKLRDNKLLLPLTSERRAKDHIISSLSNKLLDFLEDNSLTIVNGRSRGDKDGDFTYISERGSSTIDYCILSQGSLQILLDFKVDDQLYSDHHPLVLTIKGQNFNEKKTKREDYNITRYRWSADGLATFKMKLEELREKNIPASDDLVYTFNQRILEAMSSAKITYSIKGGPRKSKPWFDKDCYDMKKLAKESLKKYRKTNRLEDRECYASSRKKYLALLDLKRKGFDNEKQEILRNAKDSKTFWKTIALYKSTSIIQGEISIQDWLNFYRELMTTEKNLRICNLHNVISQNDPILDSEITNADIYKEIAGLRSNKACGPDGIPNEVLKTLPDSYILLLKQLYNSVMTTGKYPAIWTNSTIHPIFKNGYKNSPSNYRGIALISNVSKLFTSILRSRLEEWVEGRRVIPENQAGFRKERSCIDHIFTLTTLIQLSLRKKRGKLYVFFVDLRKAFDTVPHSLLWKKLYNLGISYQFISTIKSYYEQATIAIRWKGSFTESIKINSGVLQGEPLSPLLFILFIMDLIEIYNNSDLPSVNLPEFGDIHLLLYADDIAIIGESRINLQKKIKILKEYLDENLMTLNESKSKIMVFRNGGKPSNKDRWFWNDKPIAITSRYTYLGFPLTPTITTTHPANYFKGKALTAINATHPILIKSKAKSINLSIKLFDTIVRAVLMYAAPLWATEHKDLLDNIQDIFIRRFLNLPRYTPGYLIRLETGRISLSVTALKLTLKYWLRVLNMSSDRLPRICFNRTRELSNASGTPIGFIKKLTNLLNDNGSPALVSCDDPETLRSAITGLLKTAADQSIQNDLTRMDKSKLYSHYKDIHISFMTEGYLLGDFPFPVVRLLAQVRILSSFFRENHTKMLCGEDPTCTFCNSKLQNEITHYIFDCSALKEERRTLMLKTGQLCALLPSIIDNMTQNKYIATAFYGFHKSISQKKAK
ncbi:hypothetical protein LAZ67_9000960 [Cordylochernes scorpioides]|uniref:Reverse transcriptase domain-containing protein n=1 Tax=Cordylochernes scorpioides TaxID=51811 RepID=A0ABY6KW32_9ARAC|nr:hypothetical protein LAZ67_9000960 [Cordylochernes scorpioides]